MDADISISFHRHEPPRSKSQRRGFSALFVILGLVLFANPLVAAAQVPVPADLGPGESYHLVFTSSTSRNGLSANIGDYDSLVQNAANAAGIGTSQGVTWRAIASTATVAARDHALVGANTPVYNLNLERVANGNTDFWDGTLLKPLGFNEQGDVGPVDVWTGSNIDGTSANGLTLGGATAWCGLSTEVGPAWINNITPSTESVLSVYGLSQMLTVPAFTMNAGLNGNWKGANRTGEGFSLEISKQTNNNVLVAQFYTYDTSGNQAWLLAVGPVNGDSATVTVYIYSNAKWGDDFIPAEVLEEEWGSGLFVANSCDSISMSLTPNSTAMSNGFTNLEYDLVRVTTPLVDCPSPPQSN